MQYELYKRKPLRAIGDILDTGFFLPFPRERETLSKILDEAQGFSPSLSYPIHFACLIKQPLEGHSGIYINHLTRKFQKLRPNPRSIPHSFSS